LPAPGRAVAGFANRIDRKITVGRFQFLQGNDIGFCLAQPSQQVRQPAVDIVDVERRGLHVPD
jgi:hypothetical protein